MRIFGIDCGTEWTGYGVVETDASGEVRHVAHGTIHLLKRDTLPRRLTIVFESLTANISQHRPDTVVIEEVFHAANSKTALKLGQVRGVALLAAATCELPIAEYAPLAVKSAVCGYGMAQKEQVQFMVARLLGLSEPPASIDACDALALAICHIHHAQTTIAQTRAQTHTGPHRPSVRSVSLVP